MLSDVRPNMLANATQYQIDINEFGYTSMLDTRQCISKTVSLSFFLTAAICSKLVVMWT